jgi:hypothetical protein
MDEFTPESGSSLASDTHLLGELTTLAGNVHTDAQFVTSLESRLLNQQHAHTPFWQKYSRTLATIAATVLLFVAATLTIPPLRAIAQEIIDTLFNRTDSDQEIVQFGPYGILQLVPYFFMTVEEAQAEVDFDIYEPSWIPQGLALHNVAYSPEEHLVSLSYRQPTENVASPVLTIYVAPIENGWSNHPYLQIGASATVVSVEVEGIDGQVTGFYVQGFWTTPLGIVSEDGTPIAMEWDSDIPVCHLRWQDTGMIYEIWSQGSMETPCPLSIDDMVAIADSME